MFYVLDDNNNKIEALDKEGVLAALEEAIANGSLESLVADSAFVTKLKCCITGGTTKMAFVTSAQYNELEAGGAIEKGVAYFITDDVTIDGMEEILADLNTYIQGVKNGRQSVPLADYAKDIDGENVFKDGGLGQDICPDSYLGFALERRYRYAVSFNNGTLTATGIAKASKTDENIIELHLLVIDAASVPDAFSIIAVYIYNRKNSSSGQVEAYYKDAREIQIDAGYPPTLTQTDNAPHIYKIYKLEDAAV